MFAKSGNIYIELYDAYTSIRSHGLSSKSKRKGKTKKKDFLCLLISINVYSSLLGSQTCFKITFSNDGINIRHAGYINFVFIRLVASLLSILVLK